MSNTPSDVRVSKANAYISVGLAVALLGGGIGSAVWISDRISEVGASQEEKLEKHGQQFVNFTTEVQLRLQKLELQQKTLLETIGRNEDDYLTKKDLSAVIQLLLARNPELKPIDVIEALR